MIVRLAEEVKVAIRSTRYYYYSYESQLAEITCAASLAHHGLLGSVREIRLCNVDLTSVPTEHLASLASSVTASVTIKNVRGSYYDLVTILDSVKCKRLDIMRQSLDSEETQALVRAMESRVEEVRLIEEVTLDIMDLMEYSGQGKCKKVGCYWDTKPLMVNIKRNYCFRNTKPEHRYREQLWTWATIKNWVNSNEKHSQFIIERNTRIEEIWAPGIFSSDEDISHAKWLGNNYTRLLYLIKNTIIFLSSKQKASWILE